MRTLCVLTLALGMVGCTRAENFVVGGPEQIDRLRNAAAERHLSWHITRDGNHICAVAWRGNATDSTWQCKAECGMTAYGTASSLSRDIEQGYFDTPNPLYSGGPQ
jgi:hypothetical protein